MDKECIKQETEAIRVFSHGEIVDLTEGFSLKSGQPFSIQIIPKACIEGNLVKHANDAGLLVDCRLLLDKKIEPFFISFNDLTAACIEHIAPNAINLVDYRVIWSGGTKES